MFGIDSYSPTFYSNINDVISNVGDELKILVGQSIQEIWIVWDNANDEWFQDCPVILNIGNKYIELCATKLDELSITFNTINLSERLNWYDIDSFDLEWKDSPLSDLQRIRGQQIKDIFLIEYNLQTELVYSEDQPQLLGSKNSSWILHGIGFELNNGYLQICNGLDQNDISIHPDLNCDTKSISINNKKYEARFELPIIP